MPLRQIIESMLPYRVMRPVVERRIAAQNRQWLAEAAAARAALRGKDWADVCSRAVGYANTEIDRLRVARWLGRQKGRSLAESNLLSLLIAGMNSPQVSITDFGGGTGDLGEEMATLYPGLRYTVVETASLVSLMAQQRSTVHFTTDAPAECDVFHVSGTLHCLPDPLAVLERGLRTARNFGVVRRTRFSASEIFDVQISRFFDNGLGPIPPDFADCELRAPRRSLFERDVLEVGKRCGFSLCYRLADAADQDGVFVADLVLRRERQ